MMSKRNFLATAGAAVGAILTVGCAKRVEAKDNANFEVSKSPAEWRKILTPASYAVLRQGNTERSGSSPLNAEHRRGTFACAGCELPLYASAAKFESGTGWPSFTAPIGDAVRTTEDNTLFMSRIEVHCRRCGGHLGHVFNDGPAPTGKRYCMNGVAMKFIPA